MSQPTYPTYKASGVEWLGRVPSHWEVLPLKAVATCNDEVLPETTDPEMVIEYVEISGVEEGLGITQTETLSFGSAPSRARRVVRSGDVLISTVRTYLRAIATVEDPPDNLIASTGFAAIRPRRVSPGYLGYLLHCEYLMAEVISRSVGISYPAINSSDLMRLKGPIPPINEQAAIASFLDREVDKIDALVEEQRRLIELLKEKRQVLISQAVTKGLHHNVPMRDSGVEWLGKVPAHWEMTKLKHLVIESVAGPYGASLTKDMYTSTGYRVYGQQQVIPDDFSIGDYYISDSKFAEMRRYAVHEGDVLISVMGTIGKVAVVPGNVEPGIINPRLVRYKCCERIRPRYLQRVLLSQRHQEHLLFEAKGTTMDGLNMSTLGSVPVPVPPLSEQAQIVDWLAKLQRQTDALVEEAERAVALLAERRAALISSAVTGKIDVRSLLPQPEAVAA